MGWIIGFAVYAVLVICVLAVVGGVRRGDARHTRAILDLAAFNAGAQPRGDAARARGVSVPAARNRAHAPDRSSARAG